MKERLQRILHTIHTYGGKRAVSFAMIFAMLTTSLPLSALAGKVEVSDDGVITITDDQGNVTTVDETWEETFPYGTFALSNTEVSVDEGGEVTVTVYRLGGTKGRATAFIEYGPTVTLIDEDTPTFVYAAGWNDVSLTVEDPSPLAWYQPVGDPNGHLRAAGFSPEYDPARSSDNVMNGVRVQSYGDYCLHLPGITADSYRWQARVDDESEWQDVKDYTEAHLIIGNDIAYETQYNFRCIYTIDGISYCTDPAFGYEPFVEEPVEELPEMPDPATLPEGPTYTDVTMESGPFEEFETVEIPVTFAEGEWTKTITIQTHEDELIEGNEFGTLTITRHEGATLYETANKCIVQVIDNEEHLPTVLTIDPIENQYDRAAGYAEITVTRTGDLTYPVTVAYTVGDAGDTAIAGTHYGNTNGTLYFYGDAATQTITVPLISAPEPDDTPYTVSVVLSDLLGGMEEDLASLATDRVTLTLTDSGTPVDEPVNLTTLIADGDGMDVSDKVGEGEAVSAPLDAVTGTPIATQSVEELTAEIVWNDPRLRTYTYPNSIQFSRGNFSDDLYRLEYWADYETLVDSSWILNKYKNKSNNFKVHNDFSSVAGYGNKSMWSHGWRDDVYDNKDSRPKKELIEKFEVDSNRISQHGNYGVEASLLIKDGQFLFDQAILEYSYDYRAVGTAGKGENSIHLEMDGSIYLNHYRSASKYYASNATFKGDPDLDNITFKNTKAFLESDWSNLERVKPIFTSNNNNISIHFGLVPMKWKKNMDSAGNFNLEFDVIRNDTANATGEASIQSGVLRRQYFAGEFGLNIYTANDADVLPKGSPNARLDDTDPETQELYENLKPIITVVKGKGGVTSGEGGTPAGKPYVGSTLRITLAGGGSYDGPAEDASGNDYTVYLTEVDSDEILAKGVYKGRDGSSADAKKIYELTLLWDKMKDAKEIDDYRGDNKDYTIHVVMDRQQKIVVDLTPSMQKIQEIKADDGTVTDYEIIGAATAAEAREYFLSRTTAGTTGAGFITLHYATAENNSGKKYFEIYANRTLSKDSGQGNLNSLYPLNGSSMEIHPDGNTRIPNLYSINFALPEEDKIAFNGKLYAGNETIYLQSSDLAQAVLQFTYYHEACLSVPVDMKANISSATLYLDANGNGQIDGYRTTTNTFTLTPDENGVKDEIVSTWTGDFIEELDERYFEPVYRSEDGPALGYILKVWYNMNPRKMSSPVEGVDYVGDDATDMSSYRTATIQPAFTTAVTSREALKKLTEEQRNYRYIKAGETRMEQNGELINSAEGKPMFGEAATRINYVDIPLGGDKNPPYLVKSGNQYVYEWEPDFDNNLLTPYTTETAKSVAPITIPETVAGKNFQVSEPSSTKKNVDGKTYTYTYNDDQLDNLNGYLSSLVGASTYSLSIIAPTIDQSDANDKLGVDSVTMGNVKTKPNSEYLQNMQGDNTSGGVDMDESGAEYPEFNVGFSGELGATNLNLSDYMTIIVDGYNVGFSIGVPLAGYHSNGDAGAGGTGSAPGTSSTSRKDNFYGPGTANKSRGEELSNMLNYFKDRSQGLGSADDSYKNATDPGTDPATGQAKKPQYAAKGFGVELSVRVVMLFTWNPLDNGYYFSSMTVGITGSLVFTVMYRLSVCPILYAYIKLGAGLEITTGIGVARGTKRASKAALRVNTSIADTRLDFSKANPMKLNAGESVIFQTPYRAFDAEFSGAMMVEVANEYEYNPNNPNLEFVPVDEAGGKDLRTGVISSTGEGPMTVVLAEKDGAYLDDKQNPYFVRLTATEDTNLYDVFEATDVRSKVYWTGVTISPSAFLEVGVGAGVELMKVELYVSAGIGFTATVGAYNVDTEEYEGGSFDKFEFNLGLSIRIVAIVFNFDFDLARYIVTYGQLNPTSQEKGWQHSFKAGGGGYTTSEELGKSRGMTYGSGTPMVQILLPTSTADTQTLYEPAGENQSRAYNPTSEDVPFQLSATGASSDAFRMWDGLSARNDQQVITVGDDNYLLYTISRQNVAPPHDTMLVLSKIQVTSENGSADQYGLVDPITNEPGYLPVHDDNTGDFDFIGWAEGNTIHAAWVSYVDDSPLEIWGQSNESLIDAQTKLARKTQVLTASFQTDLDGFTPAAGAKGKAKLMGTGSGFSQPIVVTDQAASGSYSYLPVGGEGAVFYATADHYTDSELIRANNAYQYYLGKVYATPGKTTNEKGESISYGETADAIAETEAAYEGIRTFMHINRMSDYGLYGKGTTLHLRTDAGTESSVSLNQNNRGEILGNIEMAPTEGKQNSWILAYTTYQLAYYDHDEQKTIPNPTDADLVNVETLDEVRVQRLYIRQVTVDGSNVNWGVPKLLRVLLDMDQTSDLDGRYSGTEQKQAYADPTFSNLRFLNAILGSSLTGGEAVDQDWSRQGRGAEAETFLLFDMMGSTYVIPYQDLIAILKGDSSVNEGKGGLIYPFFVPETLTLADGSQTNSTDKTGNTATGRMEVTIGSDGEGNLAAIYVSPMTATGNNGLFISWYDPATSTWGQGKLLAMHHMQVYEDANAYNLDYEQMEKAYLGQTTGNEAYDKYIETAPETSRGSMSKFTFSDLQLALGKTKVIDVEGSDAPVADSGESTPATAAETESGKKEYRPTLLILAKGSMSELTYMDPESGSYMRTADAENSTADKTEDKPILTVKKDSAGNTANTGFYGITVGAGQQEIGREILEFAQNSFSAGDVLQPYVYFTNTGDTAIRASSTEPVIVTLNAIEPAEVTTPDETDPQTTDPDAGETGTESTPPPDKADASEVDASREIARWEIKESILAGQKVSLLAEGNTAHTLATDLPAGTIFTITVSEHRKVNAQTGEVENPDAFTATSPALFTVGDLPELRFEKLTIRPTGIDEKGNTILEVNGEISNRGSAAAEGVYLQFVYQNGEQNITNDTDEVMETVPVYAPVDLTGHNITVSTQQVLQRRARNGNPDQMGILHLANNAEDVDTAGVIGPNSYRTISGTLTVPSEYYYKEDPAGALNLKVEIFSQKDNVSIVDNIHSSEHECEFQGNNNAREVTILPQTWFQMPTNITISLGNTMRLPITVVNSTGTAPMLNVFEFADNVADSQTDWESSLDVLYYDYNAATESGCVVITPGKTGSGYIRLSDPNTGCFEDIAFKVEEGNGLNVIADNGYFTFSGDWTMQENMPSIGEGYSSYKILQNDIAVGKKDASFTFQTAAESVDIYYYGKIEVTTSLPSNTIWTYTVDAANGKDGEPKQYFEWVNPSGDFHTVTVTVLSDTAYVDKIVENFVDNKPPVPEIDPDAPTLHWSRAFPENDSVPVDETVKLIGYVLDDTGLESVKVNGALVTVTKHSDTYWSFPLDIKTDGTYNVEVRDTSAHVTTESIQANWFDAGATSTSLPPVTDFGFNSADQKLFVTIDNATNYDNYKYTLTLYDPVVKVFGTAGVNREMSMNTWPITQNGLYSLVVEDENGNWTRRMVLVENGNFTANKNARLYQTEGNPGELHYQIYNNNYMFITTATINGVLLPGSNSSQRELSGTFSIEYSGEYRLEYQYKGDKEVTDLKTVTCNAEGLPLVLHKEWSDILTITPSWNQTRNNNGNQQYDQNETHGNGSVWVDLHETDTVTGGSYMSYTVDEWQQNTTYEVAYEYMISTNGDAEDVIYYGDYDPNQHETKLNLWLAANNPTIKVEGLDPGAPNNPTNYYLHIRNASDNDKNNADLVLTYQFRIPDEAILLGEALQQTPVATGSDGSITMTVQGGKGTEGYEFAILPFTKEDYPDGNDRAPVTPETKSSKLELTPASEFTEWTASNTNAFTFTGLSEGWYQVAARCKNLDYSNNSALWDNALVDAIYVTTANADNSLQSLTLTANGKTTLDLTPDFAASTLHYTVTVPNEITSVQINAVQNHELASFPNAATELIARALEVGENTLPITVQADNGITRTYTITVTREEPLSDNAALSSLTLIGKKDDGSTVSLLNNFDPAKLTYDLTADKTITSVEIAAIANDTAAIIDSTEVGSFTMLEGLNVFPVTVTAPDGSRNVYKLQVTQPVDPEDDSSLHSLAVRSGEIPYAFNKTFYPNRLENVVVLPNDVKTIDLSLTSAEGAKIYLNGVEVKNAAQLKNILLTAGENKITLRVVSASGKNERTYTILAYQTLAPESDTTLANLIVYHNRSRLNLTPAFQPGQTNFTMTVPYDIEQVEIRAIPNSKQSTVVNPGIKKLAVGENEFSFAVTAADNSTKNYTLTITRLLSTDATLRSLSVTGYTFDKAFDPNVTSYELYVDTEVASVNIQAFTNAGTAKVSGTGIHYLDHGENEIELIVTAQDGTEKTYTILVVRGPSYFDQTWHLVMEAWNEDRAAGYDWLELSKRIRRANHNRTFTVDPLTADHQPDLNMPGYVLDALAEVTANLHLKAGNDLTWVFRSGNVASTTDNESFHLTAKLGTDRIPAGQIAAVAGDLWHTTLTLTHPGSMGVTPMLEIDLGTSQAGKEARLYKLDTARELVYLAQTNVTPKGTVLWELPEACGGDYLIVTGTKPETPAETPAPIQLYTDVATTDWFAEAVAYVTEMGLMNGIDNAQFGPEGTVNRAMLLTVLHRLAGTPAPTGTNPFTDVEPNAWYSVALHWAAAEGILTGYGNGISGATDPITREQIAVILHRFTTSQQKGTDVRHSLNGYSDTAQISSWAAEAMLWANAKGLVTGRTATTLNPSGTATRAELATILTRYCGLYS